MTKILKFFMFSLFLIFFTSANEVRSQLEDYIPQTCDEFDNDYTLYTMYKLSIEYQTPILTTTSVFTLAGVEGTAIYCDFTLTDNFKYVKQHLLSNNKINNLYQFILSNFDVNKISDKSIYCAGQYKLAGPEMAIGPNGKRTPLFK
ncbi:MAG: hypothetical protein LBW85_06210 [Deltaproteobacteria bacterium]|nr:hypothetical protein [Deltaproteobacteria bacterium]